MLTTVFFLVLINAGGLTTVGPYSSHANCMSQADVLNNNLEHVRALCVKVQ